MDFVTLGMFIIDEIHYPSPKPPDFNVMGGAGLYATLGARLFRPPPTSSKVGWVVHQGHDFPTAIRETIDSWDTNCHFVQTPQRPTTRAWNRYDPNGNRSFKYTNEKIRVDEDSLTEDQLTSKTYHLICSPTRCIDLVKGILGKRNFLSEAPRGDRHPLEHVEEPIFIWEPVPDLCRPSELTKTLEALKYVDIFSPNLEEFSSLLSVNIDLGQSAGWTSLRRECEKMLKTHEKNPGIAVIVRLGERGCYIAQKGQHSIVPAFHDQGSSNGVVDPTGGGNCFLGGLAIGLLESSRSNRPDKVREAALHGIVAASFAIEQIGVASLKCSLEGDENWNGDTVKHRLKEFAKLSVENRSSILVT
ncbi:MAG: hypothetical protein Q9220_003711 [cf. Caloplaca sp. 1 TL-2023]